MLIPSSRDQATVHRTVAFRSSNPDNGQKKKGCRSTTAVGVSGFVTFAPSEQIKVLIPSSRDQATVHRTVAFRSSNPDARPKEKRVPKHPFFFWSEYRDSNPRPLGPEPSAIPNFAIPRNPIYYNGKIRFCQSKYWIFSPEGVSFLFPAGNNTAHRPKSGHRPAIAGAREFLRTGSLPGSRPPPARRAWRRRRRTGKNISGTS